MKKIQVKAYANIALVKYWGKSNIKDNIPAVGSISIGLDGVCTRTSAKTIDGHQHQLKINNKTEGKEVERASQFVDLICTRYDRKEVLEINSSNNFPTGAGLASSASGFAALTLAVTKVLGISEDSRELSRIARRGSGSAARSVVGGYVEMSADEDASAVQLSPASDWPLEVIIAITSTAEKKTGSTDGMLHTAETSPYYKAWVSSHKDDMTAAREAIKSCSFDDLARVSEHSCMKMHAVMMSANPALIYWNEATLAIIHKVRQLQVQGHALFFTIDAGPQVKIICEADQVDTIHKAIRGISGVLDTKRAAVGGSPEISSLS